MDSLSGLLPFSEFLVAIRRSDKSFFSSDKTGFVPLHTRLLVFN